MSPTSTTISAVCASTTRFLPSRSTGKERDAESGNDYFGARYFSSTMGRWMSPDPTGLALATAENPQSLNLYAYVNNNPLSMIDPDGLQVAPAAVCETIWCKIQSVLGRIFSGGGGDDGGGNGGGRGGGSLGPWQTTPPTSGKFVTAGHYPGGAGVVGSHYGIEIHNAFDPQDDPTQTWGFATLNKHPFVLFLTGYPFAGELKKDRETYKDRMLGFKTPMYLYMPISEDAYDAMNGAITARQNHPGWYIFYFRNCAQFTEDVLHKGRISGVPHNEVFWPWALRGVLRLESALP